MKTRYYLYVVIGAITAFIEVVGVPLAMNNPNFSLGATTAERAGGAVGLMFWGVMSFMAFRAAYRVNKKREAIKQQAAIDSFLNDVTDTASIEDETTAKRT